LTVGFETGRENATGCSGKKKMTSEQYQKLSNMIEGMGWSFDDSDSARETLENGELSLTQLQTLRDARDSQDKLGNLIVKIIKDPKLVNWDGFTMLKKGIHDINKNKATLDHVLTFEENEDDTRFTGADYVRVLSDVAKKTEYMNTKMEEGKAYLKAKGKS
jgi:hypothetical protein